MRIISGEYRGRIIRTANGPGYRPATGKVREALFSMLEARGIEWSDTNVLDVFAGSGSLGLEALSRGARSALFIDNSPKACAIIRQNIELLDIQVQRARVLKSDALAFSGRAKDSTFELVFVDPPYGKRLALPVLEGLIRVEMVSDKGIVCAEIEGHLDFETDFHPGLELVKDKFFGQTRILIWQAA